MQGTTVFFDLETGGLGPQHPIIQLAAAAYDEEWNEVDSYEAKVAFDPEICDPEALKMNSYDPDEWDRDAVDLRHVLKGFGAFCECHRTYELTAKASGRKYRSTRLAGHGIVAFDVPRLREAWGDSFTPFAWWYPLDTYQLALWHFARGTHQPPSNFKLATLCEHLRIDTTGAHDALADVRMSANLARAILDSMGNR